MSWVKKRRKPATATKPSLSSESTPWDERWFTPSNKEMKKSEKFLFKHPLHFVCIMAVCNALYFYAWWPRSSLGQTEFKWLQLPFIIIPNMLMIIEFIKRKKTSQTGEAVDFTQKGWKNNLTNQYKTTAKWTINGTLPNHFMASQQQDRKTNHCRRKSHSWINPDKLHERRIRLHRMDQPSAKSYLASPPPWDQ